MTQQEKAKYFIYAEDDADDLFLLQEMVQKASSEIQLVGLRNGKEVLAFLEKLPHGEFSPCFILLDVNMPLMDGYDTLKWLKSHKVYASIPVVMYTTSSHKNEEAKALQLGAERFITKPFTSAQIEALAHDFVQFCSILSKRQ